MVAQTAWPDQADVVVAFARPVDEFGHLEAQRLSERVGIQRGEAGHGVVDVADLVGRPAQ